MRDHTILIPLPGSGTRGPTLEIWPNTGAGAMVFYPGTMLSPFQYAPLLAALREAGFAVAALHLTGHGCNRHGVGFSFEDLLRNGLDAEAWLRKAGYSAIAVCGHSQGGILALAHAAASKGLTAVFPISGVLPQMAESINLTRFAPLAAHRERVLTALTALARCMPRLPLPLPAYLSVRKIASGARRIVTSRRRIRLSYPLAFLVSLFNARIAPHLHCSLCFFSARNDALFTPELTQATFNRIEAPAKKLVWLPGGGHTAAMHPPLCRFMARTAAAVCAGLGLPLRLACKEPARGEAAHGI